MKHLVLFLFLLLSFTSCDDCKDRNCEHGYCLGDRCVCDEGYTGDHCEWETIDHYVGTSATFYTTCSHCPGLAVKVDNGGFRAFSYYYFNQTATCKGEGTLDFELSQGNHTYTTNDGRSGNFILNYNTCKLILID